MNIDFFGVMIVEIELDSIGSLKISNLNVNSCIRLTYVATHPSL